MSLAWSQRGPPRAAMTEKHCGRTTAFAAPIEEPFSVYLGQETAVCPAARPMLKRRQEHELLNSLDDAAGPGVAHKKHPVSHALSQLAAWRQAGGDRNATHGGTHGTQKASQRPSSLNRPALKHTSYRKTCTDRG